MLSPNLSAWARTLACNSSHWLMPIRSGEPGTACPSNEQISRSHGPEKSWLKLGTAVGGVQFEPVKPWKLSEDCRFIERDVYLIAVARIDKYAGNATTQAAKRSSMFQRDADARASWYWDQVIDVILELERPWRRAGENLH